MKCYQLVVMCAQIVVMCAVLCTVRECISGISFSYSMLASKFFYKKLQEIAYTENGVPGLQLRPWNIYKHFNFDNRLKVIRKYAKFLDFRAKFFHR